MHRLVLTLALIGVTFGCDLLQRGSETEPAGAPAAAAAPAPAPAPPSQRVRGTWRLSLGATIPHWPEGQRRQMMVAWLAYRPEPPTEAELETHDLGVEANLGIFMMRTKQLETPTAEDVVRGRQAMEQMQGITVEFADTLTLTTPDGRETSSFTVVRDEGDELVLDTVDEDGERDRVHVTFVGPDRIDVRQTALDGGEDDGPDRMGFVRQGSAEAEADGLGARPEAPPVGVDPPAGLLGVWGADGRRDAVELLADHRYRLVAGRGAMEGEYRVLSVDGATIVLRTRLGQFPWAMGDTIQIELRGDTLTWHNRGTDSRSTYTRRDPG